MVLKKTNKYTEGKTFVYFIRHGDRKLHPNGGLWHPGPRLSKKGISQAKSAAKKFSKIKDEIDLIYTSNMARAKETAEEIGKKINKKPIVIPEFSEIGKTPLGFTRLKPSFWKNYFKVMKAQKILDKILEKNQGKVILIVAHGGMNKMMIFGRIGLSPEKSNRFEYHNCNISLVRFDKKKLDYIHCFNTKEVLKPGMPKSLKDKKIKSF